MAGKRIGFITNFLVMEYFHYLYMGIQEEIRGLDLKVCCIPAGGFDQPDYRKTKQSEIFRILKAELFDGIIINESPFVNYKPVSTYSNILKFLQNIPCVGIGSIFPGINHVNSNNHSGITELFDHMVSHGCRNFTYISGPEFNSDAVERKAAFLESRRKHGLPENNNSVFSTTFYPAQVREIIDKITGKDSIVPDVIMCANDIIAKNTISELRKRNISVPGDIAITGFDDSVYSIDEEITTVRIPRKKQGSAAARIINSILENKDVPEMTVLPMEVVIRKTCGCNTKTRPNSELDEYIFSINDQRQVALDIHRTGQNLNTADTMQQLKKILVESIQWLSIDNYAIYLIHDFKRNGELFCSRGIMEEKLRGKAISDYRVFVNSCFAGTDSGETSLLLPLFSKTSFIGFFAVCRLTHDLVLYENLAMQISEAVQMVRQLENINSQLTRIETSLREKELLLKEIHHRVKNNLQIITSLINIKSTNKDGESLRSIISDLQTSIGSIALVHESIYENPQLNRINLSEYLRSLFRLVNQNGNVSNVLIFSLTGDEFNIELQHGINCGLIFSELFLNSIKHGFNPKDTNEKNINLSINKTSESCINFIYSDNGKGFDIKKISNKGFGLNIVRNLIKDQFGGSLIIDSAPGKGVRFDIVLKI